MKKIFLDTDVILDLILEREPYYFGSMIVFEKAENKEINLYASATCFTNLFYILRKSYNYLQVYKMLNKLIISLNILSVDSKIISFALQSGVPDFEDSVQYYTALNNNMEIILTRNTKNYKTSVIPVMTADEFLETI